MLDDQSGGFARNMSWMVIYLAGGVARRWQQQQMNKNSGNLERMLQISVALQRVG
ncbi:MAG: hypothetical protein ABJJ69_00250 [Paracoccaceae bacterium]